MRSLLLFSICLALANAARAGYEWRSFPDDKDQLSLWRDGRQIGNYRRSTDAYYPRLSLGKWGDPCAPPYPPPGNIEADGTLNFGLEVKRIRPATGKHQLNGRDVTRQEILEAIDGSKLRDDRDQLCLTVIGSAADRRCALNDLAGAAALAPWKGRLKIHGYEATHWAIRDAGFKTHGRPTIYVQAPDGKVLHRQDEYRGAEALAEVLRKADPNYRPPHDPDLNRDLSAAPPLVWLGAALLVILLFWKGDER